MRFSESSQFFGTSGELIECEAMDMLLFCLCPVKPLRSLPVSSQSSRSSAKRSLSNYSPHEKRERERTIRERHLAPQSGLEQAQFFFITHKTPEFPHGTNKVFIYLSIYRSRQLYYRQRSCVVLWS